MGPKLYDGKGPTASTMVLMLIMAEGLKCSLKGKVLRFTMTKGLTYSSGKP